MGLETKVVEEDLKSFNFKSHLITVCHVVKRHLLLRLYCKKIILVFDVPLGISLQILYHASI